MFAAFCPKRFRVRKWWRLTPTEATIDIARAIQALKDSTGTRRIRYLTIVRSKSVHSPMPRVWISFSSGSDPQQQAKAVAAAIGCGICEDDDVPFHLNRSGWKMSRIGSIDQEARKKDAAVNQKEADALASVADSYLGDGDFVLTTVRWRYKTEGIYARVVTTSDELSRKWASQANCKRQLGMLSLFAVPPLLVMLYCLTLLGHEYLQPLQPVDWLTERLDVAMSLSDIQLAWVCAFWAALRMILEICRPTAFRLVERYWHLPIGLRILFRGVPLSVSQIAGWAKARRVDARREVGAGTVD